MLSVIKLLCVPGKKGMAGRISPVGRTLTTPGLELPATVRRRNTDFDILLLSNFCYLISKLLFTYKSEQKYIKASLVFYFLVVPTCITGNPITFLHGLKGYSLSIHLEALSPEGIS